MKGNSRNSGYDRNANDWYVEPAWCVDAMLDVEPLEGLSWDPACGSGNIPKRIAARGCESIGTDLVFRGFGDGGADFLRSQFIADNIVTNPPFNLALDFAAHALKRTTRKVIILQRLAWLEGQTRAAYFKTTPLARVWVHARRVSMPPGGSDVPATGGSVAYAWYVFEHGYTGKPELGWLE